MAPQTHTSTLPKPTTPIPMLNDLPIMDKPQLGYEAYADTLASIICGDDTSNDPDRSALDNTPMTIGLFAPWGSGKSTLLSSIQQKVEKQSKQQSIVVSFNAWHHERSSDLDQELIGAMYQAVKNMLEQEESTKRHTLSDHARTATQYMKSLLSGLAHAVANTTVTVGANGPVTTEFTLAQYANAIPDLKQSANPTLKRVSEILETLPFNENSFSMSQALDLLAGCLAVADKRLVILIDDLDRCAPDSITRSIETISSLTGRAGMIFVLALDRNYIVSALETHYRSHGSAIDGTRYLEKIIQLPFTIPLSEFSQNAGTQVTIENLVGRKSWGKILGTWLDKSLKDDVRIIALEALQSNPRQTKRFINTFLLLSSMFWDRLHDATEPVDQKAFLYLLGLQVSWPGLYAKIAQYVNTIDVEQLETKLSSLDFIHDITDSEESSDDTSQRMNGLPLSVSNVIGKNEFLYAQRYLRNQVFTDMKLSTVKRIMQITPMAVNQTTDSVGRDFSKWNWTEEGHTADKIGKQEILERIAHKFAQDNPHIDKDTFEQRLGKEIQAAVPKSSLAPTARFDRNRLLVVVTSATDDREDRVLSFDNDKNLYAMNGSCGYPYQQSFGTHIQRPVIEYFRDKMKYPIEQDH